jgi:hypothetical protein
VNNHHGRIAAVAVTNRDIGAAGVIKVNRAGGMAGGAWTNRDGRRAAVTKDNRDREYALSLSTTMVEGMHITVANHDGSFAFFNGRGENAKLALINWIGENAKQALVNWEAWFNA